MPAPTVLRITFTDHLALGYGAGPYGAWTYGIGPYYRAMPAQRITLACAVPVQHIKTTCAAPAQHIAATFSEVAMTTPYTTIDSSATVTNASGAPIANLSTYILTITYQDGTTATPTVTNQGAGIYTATYATKGPGLLTELWSFVGSDGSLGQEQRLLTIAY